MNAAIYIRKSREEKDKPSHRLTVQREQLPAYAEAQGWRYTVYDDGHASAARGKTEDLKERARLEADIRAGRVDLILTIELSRLSRDDSLQDYVAWLHLCSQMRVKLATLSRMLDPAQHSDWMLLLMEGGFSSVEMRVLQSRMAEGREQALREGRFLGGQLPAPYVHGKTKGAPVIDPAELARMQRLWQLAETQSTRSIAQELGLPLIAVRRALCDDRLLFYQARRIGKGGEEIACEWEPCMDAAQAERIRANRKTRHYGGVKRPAGGLLSNLGLLVCGYCGRSVRSWKNARPRRDGTRLDYYGCKGNELKRTCPPSRMVAQSALDERVLVNVFRTLANSELLQEAWRESATDQGGDRLAEIAREEAALAAKKQRLIAAIVDGVISFADGKTQRGLIESALDKLTREKGALAARCQDEPDWETLALTREEFEEFDFDEQRELLALVLREVKVYGSYMLLDYRFPRSVKGETTARVHLPPAGKPGPKAKGSTKGSS